MSRIGYSAGQSALDATTCARLEDAKSVARALWSSIQLIPKEVDDLEVTGLSCDVVGTVVVQGKTHERVEVRVRGKAYDGDGSFFEFDEQLTPGTIEESLAFEIERLLVQRAGEEPHDADVDPYSILNRIAAFAWPGLSPESLVRCGLACLQSGDPARKLTEYLLEKREPTASEATEMVQAAIPIVTRAFDEFQRMYSERGLGAMGLASVIRAMKRYLELRLTRPFFELEMVEAMDANPDALRRFLDDFAPCEVLCEFEGREDARARDVILAFGEHQENPEQEVEGRRGLQAQVHAMRAHLDDFFRFQATENAEAVPCPFYTTCERSPRVNSPEMCRESPWKTTDPSGGPSCWYGSGFLGLSAIVRDLNKVADPDP